MKNPEVAPSVEPYFLALLDQWSVKQTGRAGQYRPAWNEVENLWMIELNVGGFWSPIIQVTDHQAATRDNMRPYRRLDCRVIEDLAASSMMEAYGTGDLDDDAELHKKETDMAQTMAEDARRLGNLDMLTARTLDAGPHFARLQAIHEKGHAHGTRSVYAVRGP